MYRCVYCFVPVALSWAPSHLCLKNFNFLHVDEYSLVTGHEAPHNNNEEAVCVSAELQVDKHWTTVVTYMEMNTDILTDQTVDGPFNRSCAKETIKGWVSKTVSKYAVLKRATVRISLTEMDLIFSDPEKRLLHLIGLIPEYVMSMPE
ncbi:uncharacterized protein [Venturia canescens]|uniref:uncharacterized protein n=1 Tax=Venturia canescens TaxID=32260 RepID=UPI001C9BEAC4|nr:uncharacterized protein LOC122407596 [Venturia canescens]XP_043269854.1 uncharacterized protein LOC122407596 [Venturia canescens]XP_043269855.1 uncharacterized protein LOC122407596 [Venturia canescens]